MIRATGYYYKHTDTNSSLYHLIWDELFNIYRYEKMFPHFTLMYDFKKDNWSERQKKQYSHRATWFDWITLIKPKHEIEFIDTNQHFNLTDFTFNATQKGFKHPNFNRLNINIKEFADIILSSFNIKRNTQPTNITFLNRRCNRRILNEKEIKDVLTQTFQNNLNFVEFENTDLKYQIETFNNSQIIIAPEGAALTHILFMQPGTKVIAIHPFNYNNSWIVKNFPPVFCKNLNIDFYFVRGEPFDFDKSNDTQFKQRIQNFLHKNNHLHTDQQLKVKNFKNIEFEVGGVLHGLENINLNDLHVYREIIKNQNIFCSVFNITQYL